eukprot:TRINITY_DN9172_c1_g1_i1.p1 TRINITY_DN9172_c1_g1~~TRINITY_DN9172_c1_g1_i1.p1  ORF type:complete len:475 (+),score=91.34 TRINITY_DN9172_c1_g1_i1:112-1536(+)
MDWVSFEMKQNQSLSPFPTPLLKPPPSPPVRSDNYYSENKISPSILLIIIILAIIFFISGLLHLLVRFLLRPSNGNQDDGDDVTVLQGQLQQLFHLHDAGVDQSFIDTLPVFHYKAIIGLKNPFDCAVCLCEFESNDKLRLLPKCSHAFHVECIDTWLLSHSTCPLCRGSLLSEFPSYTTCSPVILALESNSEISIEPGSDRDAVFATSTQVGVRGEGELGSSCGEILEKSCEIAAKEEEVSAVSEAKVVPVKLGKFRNVDVVVEGGEGSSSNVDVRRCFSMGSFEYVLDDSSVLQVAIKPPMRKQASKKSSLPLTPGHRSAMSECDCHSMREGFKGFDTVTKTEIDKDASISGNASIGRSKRESFSVSKIWLRSKKDKSSIADASRRASSFRFPVNQMTVDDLKTKHNTDRRTVSEIDVGGWESRGSELGSDDLGSCTSAVSRANTPSFARRTLLWLVGRQNKVVHSSSSMNV